MKDGGRQVQYVMILICLAYPPTSFCVTVSISTLSADTQSGTFVPRTGYLGIGKDNLLPNGNLDNKYLARVLIKALKGVKAHAKETPDQRATAVAEIKLLRNPKTMADALSTPQRQRWIKTINSD